MMKNQIRELCVSDHICHNSLNIITIEAYRSSPLQDGVVDPIHPMQAIRFMKGKAVAAAGHLEVAWARQWQELATSRWRGGPQAVHAEPRILQVALLPRGHQLKPASYVRRAVPHSRPPRSGEVPLVL
ncbi:hypothetical protein V6N12_074766 [Hibiscus sabdariffa]|uniref:Uncharacterized protein n=1 Tax=Hibiscus sabdariffa TaxID=183260 RepID=A0ABR2D2C6_9ROSI